MIRIGLITILITNLVGLKTVAVFTTDRDANNIKMYQTNAFAQVLMLKKWALKGRDTCGDLRPNLMTR